jgi:ATP-binding cassette subfamily B protein
MAQENFELDRFRSKNDRFVDALLRRQLTSTAANLIPSTVLTLSTLLIFLIGGYQVIAQSMTLGAFVAFMAYHARLTAPVHNIMTLYTGLAAFKVSVRRVMELMDAPTDVQDGNEPLEWCTGAIEFRGVSFRHDRNEILRDLSFTIPAGAFAVVLGSSGAGKSSIANLIVRLYDPDSGMVLLDDHDIRKYRLRDLRRKVVLVEQDSFLFNTTIEENIRYGGDLAPPSWLPDAPPQTVAGDRGLSLSGGEKQRIAIARALARNPEVLILDEATSAMDPDLEKAVLEDIRFRMKDRTVILITHRVYLASLAGAVFHLEDGLVVSTQPCFALQS